MKALSIRAPWWWYIIHGYKDIENRDWPARFRGRVLIHVGKWWNAKEIMDDLNGIHMGIIEPGIVAPPRLSDLLPSCGRIVGSVEIVDCVSDHNSRWFFGEYGFVLRSPIVFDIPIPFKGALGFFDVPDDLLLGRTA